MEKKEVHKVDIARREFQFLQTRLAMEKRPEMIEMIKGMLSRAEQELEKLKEKYPEEFL